MFLRRMAETQPHLSFRLTAISEAIVHTESNVRPGAAGAARDGAHYIGGDVVKLVQFLADRKVLRLTKDSLHQEREKRVSENSRRVFLLISGPLHQSSFEFCVACSKKRGPHEAFIRDIGGSEGER
jgi:hypothetical protein